MQLFLNLVSLATLLSFGTGVDSLSAAEWRKQSIYQVVTDRFARTDLSTTAPCNTAQQIYCGGTWRGLISKLDYIQDMGFTAIWISPFIKQIDGNSRDGSSYHGYWAQDIWAVNPAFGTEDDLVALSAALHARGMYLMVDVAPNHMAYMGCGTCVDYGSLRPFNSASFYHPHCWIDYNNQTSIEVCWQGSNTVSLPDLRTENADVRRVWYDWANTMLSRYSIDGWRIDSAKHTETSFWSGWKQATGNSYLLGEVYNGDYRYVVPYQSHLDGLLDYPSYYWILRAFRSTSGSISELVNGLNALRNSAQDPSLWGSFLENHDVERFAYFTKDMSLAKNALAFTMLKDGIPIIYQGQEHHYAGSGVPNNREALWFSRYSTTSDLYTFIAKLNHLRTHAIAQDTNYLSYKAHPIFSDTRTIAMRKGFSGFQLISIYTNAGSSSGSSVSVSLPSSSTGFIPNQQVIDILSCTSLSTDNTGIISTTLTNGLPRALYPAAALSGSGICPDLTGPGTTTSTTITTTTTTTTTTSTSTPISSATPSCPATVPVTFDLLASTNFGDTVKIVGNVPALGSWNAANAIALSAAQYSTSNPLWRGTIQLAPGSALQYKFIRVSNAGTVTWESDPNRVYSVSCAAATVSGSWR